MSISPLAYVDSLRIGTVDFVSPSEIKVLLDIEAPEGTALNTGTPRAFPKVNGYVLIASDCGYLVGQIEWITIERSQYPKRKGMQDFGLVDLPYPLRKMSLNPLGCLIYDKEENDRIYYKFQRGVESYPTVGTPVILPTQHQLQDIVESGDNRRVCIGTSPLANGAKVMIDPDRLFGRHLAVLGNTGSGKSCSVAGLIRWSLDAAEKVRHSQPNARFIILDPNGEYSETFKDKENVRIFSVEPKDEDIQQLQVPLWLWNSSEWVSFTQASPKTQRPTLIQALRSVREGVFNIEQSAHQEMKQYLRTLISITQIEINSGSPWGNFPKPKNFFEKLKKWKIGFTDQDVFDGNQQACLTEIIEKITHFEQARSAQYAQFDFDRTEISDFLQLLKTAYTSFGGSAMDALPIDADIPRPFSGENLLKSIEGNAELLGVSEYIDTMQMRIKTLLSDTRMKVLTSQIDGAEKISLDGWLSNYIGNNNASNGTVTVIDLSLVPAEIAHIIAATIARMTLESLQRYRRMNHGQVLPTVLVMEEAHTFVKRYKDDTEYHNSSSICCQVFEKIAREGRKFGLGMMLSSQRPSELSPTVLSQCNSFLLHRISNERDQELIHKLVPDNLRGLLRDLPSLPSRNAILLGWASELPVLVQMNHLSTEHRPRSDDPDYWNVWTGQDQHGHQVAREVNWKEIADDWQQV